MTNGTTNGRRWLAGSLRLALLLVILALLVLGLQVAPTLAQDDDLLLFARIVTGEEAREGIYVINADGSGERPIALFSEIGYPYSLDTGGYRCPVWSPDGSQIAFNGALDGRSYLVVMNADGTDARTIYEVQNDSSMTRQIHYPRWIPNSDRLSFSFTEADPTTGNLLANGVRTVALDGSDVQTIRDDITLTYPTGEPVQINSLAPNFMSMTHAWSPDGSQIAMSSYNYRVYLANPDGSNLREMASSEWAAGGVDWAADGRIASSHFFAAIYTPEDVKLEPAVPFPTDMLDETLESIAWSPDGMRIAYTSYQLDISVSPNVWRVMLRVVDLATGEERELVRTPDFGRGDAPWGIACVDWKPDGE